METPLSRLVSLSTGLACRSQACDPGPGSAPVVVIMLLLNRCWALEISSRNNRLTARKDQHKKMTAAAMHTDDLLRDRHQHDPKQVPLDVWRCRIRVGDDGGERNRDADVDGGLSGDETGVIFRLVNAEAVRRTGEFIFSLFSCTLCSSIMRCCLLAKLSNTECNVGTPRCCSLLFPECSMM